MKNILILLLFPFILFSQNTPKAKKAYVKAVELFEVSNDKKAKDLLMSAIRHLSLIHI